MTKQTPIAPVIRIMRAEDYRNVHALWSRCTGFSIKESDDSEEAILAFLNRNPSTCFVAEDAEGNIVGAILAGTDGRRSRIYHTAVDANTRGMGIGTLLVNHVAEALRSLGQYRRQRVLGETRIRDSRRSDLPRATSLTPYSPTQTNLSSRIFLRYAITIPTIFRGFHTFYK